MKLPSITAIRRSLADIKDAVVDEPETSKVDLGVLSHVPIHQPDNPALSDPEISMPPAEGTSTDEEPSIIFEIPPRLDERLIREALGHDSGHEFERLVQINGIDALGWYYPFHYQVAQHGIYLSSKGVLQLALHCFSQHYSDDPREDISRKIQYAAHAILRHETFHFAVECMAANWELSTGTACYIKANKQLRNSAGYIEDEEALANAYMLRGFRWPNSVTYGACATRYLKNFTKRQPAGYNRGANYVTPEQYESGCRLLAFDYHNYMNVKWFAPRSAFDSLTLYPNPTRIDWRRCPVILLDEAGLFATLGIVPKFINCIAGISETPTFKKQLHRLGANYLRKWDATKTKLVRSTSIPGLDFKPWPPRGKGWFSVRVDGDVRAHLLNDDATRTWSAEEVGRHGAMGH
jgi:hypothetical protein